MSTLHPYQDRKKLKWMGFYLSEHTKTLAEIEQEESYVIEPKPEMTPEEINAVLTEARLKNKSIEIQTNEIVDDSFLPDVVGNINGYNDLGLYVGHDFVAYESIRNVDFHEDKKWFDVK
ncbi:hypothetical protein [Tetragenococcus halophilus]|uniref:DNA-directed RNA polymerase beta subunit n=1 Tax=Tetragenococcus halophilus TaxID=51669 RepID=A0AB35HQL5_TETHA|nr:hypothetical protein [Tetragenococcus halophilus]MCO8298419.1 hypothetical protein [Tetragenococcus halophilus]